MEALDARSWRQPGWSPRPVTGHDPELHRLKHRHPYFGYVEVAIDGIRPFAMMSNNDDVVAQVYFWYGPDAYEPLSLRAWRRMSREAGTVVDVGSYTGLFTLAAAMANPDAKLHAVEPSPDAFARLVMNLAVNRLGQRVVLHEVAAAEQQGTERLLGYQGVLSLSTGSSLEAKQDKAVTWSREVEACPLHSLVAADAGGMAIKIDAEEAEHRVVAGLGPLVSARPLFLIEIASVELLYRCLEELPGYCWAILDDERHTFLVEDDAPLRLRDRQRRGEATGERAVLPPNIMLWPGDTRSLRDWLTPLAAESDVA